MCAQTFTYGIKRLGDFVASMNLGYIEATLENDYLNG